jgi:uncharacterized Zn finger protein
MKNGYLCCEKCHNELKRQLIGSNVFYYCRECGRISSAKDITNTASKDNGVEACV